jgi:hypothetical protein
MSLLLTSIGQAQARPLPHIHPTPIVVQTPNYAGYGARGTDANPIYYSQVNSTWKVSPLVSCGLLENSNSATWVGLASPYSGDLEQIGTESQCIHGFPRYSAFWEVFNKGRDSHVQTISLSVSPNDEIEAVVGSLGHGQFQVQIWDISTHIYRSYPLLGDSSPLANSVAECIEEDPDKLGTEPLAHFSPVTMNGCSAAIANTSIPIAYAGNTLIEYTTSKELTGDLVEDTFTVSWLHQ